MTLEVMMPTTFLSSQLDYLHVLLAVFLFATSAMAWSLSKTRETRINWKYFSLFLGLQGLSVLWRLIGLIVGTTPLLAWSATLSFISAALFLFELARTGWRDHDHGFSLPARIAYPLLILLALSGRLFGPEGLAFTVRFCLGVLVPVFASHAFFNRARPLTDAKVAQFHQRVSLSMLGYAVLNGFGTIRGAAIPDVVQHGVGPVVLTTLLVIVMFLAILGILDSFSTATQKSWRFHRQVHLFWLPLFAAALLGGWLVTNFLGRTSMLEPQQDIQREARTVARLLDDDFAHVTGESARDVTDLSPKALEKRLTFFRGIGILISLLLLSLLILFYLAQYRLYLFYSQLSQQEQFLSIALHSIGVGVTITNTAGQIINMNPAAEAITGWLFTEVSGQSLESILRLSKHPDPPTAATFPFRDMLRELGPATFTSLISILDRNGKARVLSCTVSRIQLHGQPTCSGAVLVFRDISHEHSLRKQAETSEENMRFVLSNAPVIVWRVDQSGRFILAGGATMQTGGAQLNDATGGNVFERFSDYPDLIDAHRRALRGHSAFFTIRMRKTMFDVFVQPIFEDREQPIGAIGIAVDVTEKTTAEQKYRLLFDTSRDAILIADTASGTILDCNGAAGALFLRPRHELIGLHQRHLHLDPVMDGDVTAEFRRYCRESQGKVFETTIIRSDGVLRDVSIVASPFEWNNRAVLQGILRDITEQKNIERERMRLQSQLIHSSKLASIGTLAAGVAHEINNPLMIIKGSISLLHEAIASGTAGPAEQGILEKQSRAVDRCATIVNGLRIYARADNEAVHTVDVHAVIRDTLSICESIYLKAGIAVDTRLEARRPSVQANEGKLQQVLLNLLSNASDAVEGCTTKTITIATSDLGERVRFTVTDTGCGIPASNAELVFDPFFTTKPQGKGTGLGLSISEGIVRSFGGTLRFESQVGHNTSFIVELPLSPEPLTPPSDGTVSSR